MHYRYSVPCPIADCKTRWEANNLSTLSRMASEHALEKHPAVYPMALAMYAETQARIARLAIKRDKALKYLQESMDWPVQVTP